MTMRRRVLTAGTLFISICILLGGCGGPAPDASPETDAATPSVLPAAAKGDGGWMDGIPSIVPRFSYGTMKDDSSRMDTGNGTMYSLYYGDVSREQAVEYLDKLRAAGFQVVPEESRGVSASGSLEQGEGKIGFSLSWQESGHVDFSINDIKKYNR
jgi:hypothetical protein